MYLKYIFILILVLFITITLIIPFIWCINPALLTNLKYETVSKLKIEDFEEPCLFICNHDRDQFLNDQMIACTEATKTKLKLNIISHNKESDIFTRTLKKLPLFPKYNLLYTQNNLVEKCKEISKKEHLWMFLFNNDNIKTGAYYITKDTNTKIVLVKIKKEDNRIIKSFKGIKNFYNLLANRKFSIEYQLLENKNCEDPKLFMKNIYNKLYGSS